MTPEFVFLSTCLLLLPSIATAGEPRRVVPVDGEPFQATLLEADTKWRLTFDADGRRRQMPAGELVRFGTLVEATRGPLLVLSDGGVIVADVLSADKDRVTIDSRTFATIEVPRKLIAAVIFSLPTRPHDRDLLIDRASRADVHDDLVILTNGDETTGSFHSIREHTLRLDSELQALDVDTDRVRAVLFNPALLHRVEDQHLTVWTGLRDGSRLLATRLLLQADSLEVTIADGLTLKTTADQLACLQPLGGRATYLSDMKPAGYRHLPFLDLHWPYHTDRTVLGGLLRSGGKLYVKGLGMHSAARLTYELDQPYKRFQATLDVDDHTAGDGSVRFRVFVDGRQKYASQTVRGGDPPLNVSVDLTDAKRLDLIVDYADKADTLDHADWLDARLIR